jgi:hypothetical protein
MGIELPNQLADLLNELGYIWPKSDETKLLELGRHWISLGDTLGQIHLDAGGGARTVVEHNSGTAIDAFQAKWTAEKSALNTLEKAVRGGPLVGAALFVCAGVVLALKITVIVQLTILVVEIVQAIATAPETFGGSLLEVPVFKKITGLAINLLINEALKTILG